MDNDFGIDDFCQNLSAKMEALDISGFPAKDRHLKLIAKKCSKLEALDITGKYLHTL